MKHNKFKPYIRKARGDEKADDFRVAFRLAFYARRRKPFYVLCQHGFPELAMECGASKREIANSIVPILLKHKTFKQWARAIKNRAKNG